MQVVSGLHPIPDEVTATLRATDAYLNHKGWLGYVVEVVDARDGRGTLVYFPSVRPSVIAKGRASE